MTDFGYGADLSSSKVVWKPGYQRILLEKAIRQEPLKQQWEDYCEENCPELCNKLIDGSAVDDAAEEFIADFVDQYEDDSCCWDGAEGLLTELINLERFNGEDIFVFDDCCLFVPARIPVDDADRLKRPTIPEIETILTEYLTPRLEVPVDIDGKKDPYTYIDSLLGYVEINN